MDRFLKIVRQFLIWVFYTWLGYMVVMAVWWFFGSLKDVSPLTHPYILTTCAAFMALVVLED